MLATLTRPSNETQSGTGLPMRRLALDEDPLASTDGSFTGSRILREKPLGGPVPFAGHALETVKSGGLVKLPWFVRRNFSSQDTSLFLGMHATSNCLIGSSTSWWQQLTLSVDPHRFNPSDGIKPAAPLPVRRLFGFCEEFYRPLGAVKLPSWARAIAMIDKRALFVGTGETFEIWALEEALKSSDVNLVALAHAAMKLQS
ncbi:hypothetical protein [Sphingomonas sp. LT1P40]|uniref:hypothetical protein n=1 Tax=Alteristakelama amylovorans TaxID=3096166 RepID=UPI002FCC8643